MAEPRAHALSTDIAVEVERIKTCVRLRLSGRIRDFQIILKDETLVLTGYATSYYAKQIAQQTVIEATNVPIALNAIQVGKTLLPTRFNERIRPLTR